MFRICRQCGVPNAQTFSTNLRGLGDGGARGRADGGREKGLSFLCNIENEPARPA